MTKKVLLGFIVVTGTVFSFIYAASQAYLFAALAIGVGSVWFILEVKEEREFGTVFFLAFLALAILRSMYQAPVAMLLLGLSTDLAAWDLSRFRIRIASETEREAVALLETGHLRKLAVTACAGFFVALLPVFVQISVSFVALLLIILVTMIALRRSMFYLRQGSRE
jgi:hypothetical protein